ncbi:transferrin receptor 1a isoform X2 [Nelusetta ayraudi]|uniref:transferrin receptor 1a isoform X2 n=1 Tax=Nelusetta ayraudi TaxID=303726 RepID=UPI003F71DE8D
MDQARSTISKIFNGEPHSYTRFNLTQNMEGDDSHVEMKLSSDVDEEAGGNGVGEHLNHNRNNPPVAQKRSWQTTTLIIMAAVALFTLGILIGYYSKGKKDGPPTTQASTLCNIALPDRETGAAPIMDWTLVKSFLAKRITPANFESAFSEFTSGSHRAGSGGDQALANKIQKKLNAYGLTTWNDEHFVKVQDPPVGYNKFVFKNASKGEYPRSFLSYSASKNVTGAVLYAFYGEERDFSELQKAQINMNGKVMLVRAGRISFAEKVANAAKVNAAAVLIYPDPDDFEFEDTTELFGHVHMGSGDPYTPGFPSFNHTQFPPTQSSGLPTIPAQTITAQMASSIIMQLGGPNKPVGWKGPTLGDENDIISLEVNNVLTEKKIYNLFGVIKGYVEPEKYLVIGARRDAWGPGFASSTVGTSILVELARSISEMVKHDGFRPRRSIIFASWSGGEYGSVGATEWLEGYLTSLNMKAFSYIDLDGVVAGGNAFKVAASPLMYSLIKDTLMEVKVPNGEKSLFSQYAGGNWETNILESISMDSAAYPFLAFSGIPSLSFRFTSDRAYPYMGTIMDSRDKLNKFTSNQVAQVVEKATQFAGHMALRLVHDHLLRLDLAHYDKVIRKSVSMIISKVKDVKSKQPQQFPQNLTTQFLITASGWYGRAVRSLMTQVQNTNLEDVEMCRILNERIMTVEKNFLSPYMSPLDAPFRHILLGSGPHTFKSLSSHLEALKSNSAEWDAGMFRTQFALATSTIQGCADSLTGDIWVLKMKT